MNVSQFPLLNEPVKFFQSLEIAIQTIKNGLKTTACVFGFYVLNLFLLWCFDYDIFL